MALFRFDFCASNRMNSGDDTIRFAVKSDFILRIRPFNDEFYSVICQNRNARTRVAIDA